MTVSARNIIYIKNATLVYQMLKALKKHLAPMDEARILEVKQKYQRLKRYNKWEKVEKWLKDWEITYADAKELQLPEVTGNCLQIDFTRAIRSEERRVGKESRT